jgi:DNA-binding MarR family transcriptional regulator
MSDPREAVYNQILRSAAPEAVDSILLCVKMLHTCNVLEGQITRGLSDYGISLQAFNVLCLLEEEPEQSLPLSELSRLLFTTPANITGLVDAVSKRGWVERVQHPVDRRVKLARLLPAGLEALRGMKPTQERSSIQIASGLSGEELRTLTALLDKWRASL